ATFEFDDEAPASWGAGQTHGAHRRLGAGTDEPYFFTRRKSRPDARGELDFEFRGHAVTGAAPSLAGDGFDDLRMCMTENQRAPGTYVVDVFVPIGIPQARACRVIDNDGVTADSAARKMS